MSKKLSLLFAAAMLAFTFQTARAQDEDDIDFDDDQQIEEMDSDYDSSRWTHSGRGRHWEGGPGRGPAMQNRRMGRNGPDMERGPRMHRGPGMDMGRGMHQRGFHFGMMDRLDLTTDQQRQMVDIMTENYRERLLARLDFSEASDKLRDLQNSDNPDHDAIIAANEAVGSAKGKMDVVNRKMQNQVKTILTPEQQQKMEEFGKRDRGFKGRRDRDDKKLPPHMKSGPGSRKIDKK